MKIAVVTEDGKHISSRVGRAPYCLVFTVEQGQIVEKHLRDKIGHHPCGHTPHHEHSEDHACEDHACEDKSDTHAAQKQKSLLETIRDCDTVIVPERLCGAYLGLEAAGIRTIVTKLDNAEAAVQACLTGAQTEYKDWLG